MADDQFNEIVKRAFAEFERKNGRVPTIQELADTLHELADKLGVDPRIFARKLKNAIAYIGTDNHVEGTSAFKSTLRELLSSELLLKGMPGFMELNMLLDQAQRAPNHFSKLEWKFGKKDYSIRFNWDEEKGHFWFMSGPTGTIFARITNEIGDILILLNAVSNGEKVDSELITHMHGEPVPYEREDLPYQDPIPVDQLPPNVLPFRKPYQHSDE